MGEAVSVCVCGGRLWQDVGIGQKPLLVEDPAGRRPFAKICFRLEHMGGAKEWAWVATPVTSLSNQLLSHWTFLFP